MWFLRENVQAQFLIMSAIIIIPVSILFSQLISESRSWLAIAGFHSVGNIAFMAGMLELESQTRFTIAGIALLIMIAIHTCWKKRVPEYL